MGAPPVGDDDEVARPEALVQPVLVDGELRLVARGAADALHGAVRPELSDDLVRDGVLVADDDHMVHAQLGERVGHGPVQAVARSEHDRAGKGPCQRRRRERVRPPLPARDDRVLRGGERR